MEFIRQISELISYPPGSFIYHLITIFSLQVVFAISYSTWRRRREDDYARNMAWAAGAIFFGRLILLFAGLYFGRDLESAAGILPPLEQAINSASVALLVWAIVPNLERYPRAKDILLIGTLILIAVMTLFFAQEWRELLAVGNTAYFATQQASAWALFQITTLAVGLVYLLFRGRSLGALPPIILATLLAAHIIHFWNYPEFVPTDSNVAYWVRLGYLIALPLWAVYAYMHAMTPLLMCEARLQDSLERFGSSYEHAAQAIATQHPQRRLAYSLELINQLFDPPFAAIGLIDKQDDQTINFYSALPGQPPAEMNSWKIIISDNATLNAALAQDQTTEILRDGLGSRQLYSFFQAADLEPVKSLLIQPLVSNGNRIGLLVLSVPENGERWLDQHQQVVPGLAHFIAQAIVNSQIAPLAIPAAIVPDPAPVTATIPAAIVMDRVRVQDLEHDLEKARNELEELERKRRQAEANAVAAQKQARYLAAALRALQSPPNHIDQSSLANNNIEQTGQDEPVTDNDRDL